MTALSPDVAADLEQRDGEVAQIADTEASSDARIRQIARSRGFRSMLFTPLMSNGAAIGMIGVTRLEPGSFAAHHLQLLRTFADQAVIAIENVRMFDEVQAKTRGLTESLQQQTATADNAPVDESLNLAYHGACAEKPQFNVTLRRDFDPQAGMIDVFPQEISRVFLNLITNGFYVVTRRKSDTGSPDFEPVLQATRRGLGDSVEIRIRDNGTGIAAKVREKMFNPFFTTKPADEGTGLGLSMSHDIIVKQHGGWIDVETEPGHFTEFKIVLPRVSNP